MSDSLLYRESRKFASLAAGTHVLRGNGNPAYLHYITVAVTDTGSFSVYDNTSAVAEDLFLSNITDTGAQNRQQFTFGVYLDKGLTIVVTGANLRLSVTYE
jgi:hypothetical protein